MPGGAGRARLLRLLAFLIAALLSFQSFLILSHEAAVVGGPSSPRPPAIGGPSSSSPSRAAKEGRRGGAAPVVDGRRDDDRPTAAEGTATFTPEEFLAGRRDGYVNLPVVDRRPADPHRRDVEVRELAGRAVPPPAERLVHAAPAPPGADAILGLAAYPNGFATGWRRLVGSLRRAGYDGHVIMGVHPDAPPAERDYLERMGVTYYAVEVANCTPSILVGGDADGAAAAAAAAPGGGGKRNAGVRDACSTGLEDLKLEWGRYEMARRWLRACETCTGWSMVVDTRDVFFQSDPFASLGDPDAAPHDLLFVEEVASHTSPLPLSPHRATNLGRSARFASHAEPCYGRDAVGARLLVDRPMLCSGTVIGTRDGMHRFLTVLVDEFRRNNGAGPECRSPRTTDQWTMNHLYYRGRFGGVGTTRTLPWGTGPVLTVGTPCVDPSIRDPRERTGRSDMMAFDPDTGLILNPHEGDGSACRVAPAVHQYDRCHGWIRRWFEEHGWLFGPEDDGTAVAWVRGAATANVGGTEATKGGKGF